MAVYTPLEREDLTTWLAEFRLGELLNFEGIAAGIENTNYFVTTTKGEYVLTLFESLDHQQLPFYLQLLKRLAQQLPVPAPIADGHGHTLLQLAQRPAALFPRLPGHSVDTPTIEQCQAMAVQLARWHLLGEGMADIPANPRGYHWWNEAATQLLPRLEAGQQKLLQQELAFQSRYRLGDLPRGLIHADLFRDNVLFCGNRVSGILDVYAACEGSWLYDLAITVIDWACGDGRLPDPKLSHAILSAYHEQRPLTALERGAWPVVMRQAALRFWLSRLVEWHSPREAALAQARDPDEFAGRLAEFVINEAYLRDLWPKL